MIKRIYAKWVYVRDIEESRKFYEEALGMKVKFSSPDGKWIEFDLGDTSFAILQRPAEKGPLKPEKTRTMFQIENMEEAKRRLEEKGAKIIGDIRVKDYGKLLTFEDPNGHWLELFEEGKGID